MLLIIIQLIFFFLAYAYTPTSAIYISISRRKNQHSQYDSMIFDASETLFEADHRVWAAVPSAGETSEHKAARLEAQAIGCFYGAVPFRYFAST